MRPLLDGETSDPVWRNIKPFMVTTNQGGNFDGTGETRVEIRAVHDGTWAYFLFVWEDPTRSLKQLPLKKTADGWTLLHDGYERGDEHKYNEDKFSVLLTTLDVTLAGDRTFHASPQPLADAPPTSTGRGLHYTMDSNTYVDVWQWKATSTGASRLDGRRPFRAACRGCAGSGRRQGAVSRRIRTRSRDRRLRRQLRCAERRRLQARHSRADCRGTSPR